MPTIFHFDWDEVKARANQKKHTVGFMQAEAVFRDPLALTIYDEEHSDEEERWITTGLTAAHQHLVVVHTFQEENSGEVHVRIISARHADRGEIADYQEAPR